MELKPELKVTELKREGRDDDGEIHYHFAWALLEQTEDRNHGSTCIEKWTRIQRSWIT